MRHRHKRARARFWNKEYAQGADFTLSETPSEDLAAFARWLMREHKSASLNKTASVLDVGCGNGRNLIYLAREFGVRGTGYDSSRGAIGQARRVSAGLPLSYDVRSIALPLPLPDESQTLVLDMMASHFLSGEERARLQGEILRVLKPGGWLFMKTFLREEDIHAARLLREHPGMEKGTYIHPRSGLAEHVFTEDEIVGELSRHFIVHKIKKSHRHLRRGRAWKRRSISLYAQKNG